jgi:DNA-binding transcriptional MerR regulator
MRIGLLARRTGVSVRMLRHYEDEGLLSPARTSSGYRDFRSEDEAIVEQIKLLSAAGLTLPAVRQFLPCALDARGAFEPCDELKALVQKHLARLNGKMDALARSRALLEAVMVRLDERA